MLRFHLYLNLIVVTTQLVLAGHAQSEPQNQLIKMGLNSSRTISIPKIIRIATGNSKIVKTQSLSNSQLLIMAKSRGNSTVRVWTQDGKEHQYDVRVLASETENTAQNASGRDVIKVSLEFLELDETFSQSTGFKWPDAIQFSGAAKWVGDAASMGLNYEFNFSTGQAWLHHLVQEGWAKVIAKPDLYVRLGEEAIFHSGGEFPVATSVDNFGQSYRRVEWKNYGLTAKVLPQSIDNIHISSDINLEISELIASQNNLGIPSLNKRTLKTKMNSIEGDMVVLSGLSKQTAQKEKEGIPFLSSIPLIGSLFFSQTSKSADRTELLMAVTFSMASKAKDRTSIESFHRNSERFD